MSDRSFSDEERRSEQVGFYDTDGETTMSPTVQEVEIQRQACLNIWVLKVCVEYARGELEVELFLLGQFIGGGTISKDNPELCLGAGIGLAKAKVCVSADFDKDEAVAEGEACRRKWTGGWTCRSFRTRLFSW